MNVKSLAKTLPILSITVLSLGHMEYLFEARGGCEDTDREGDPSGLRNREETSGFSSPSSVPVHEIFDSHTVWQISKPHSRYTWRQSCAGMQCYACIYAYGIFKYNQEHCTAFMNYFNMYIFYINHVKSDWLERSAWFIWLKRLLIQYNSPDSSKYRVMI